MRNKLTALAAVVLIAVVPTIAGEHKKCTMNTQDCLNAMAAKLKTTGWIGVELDMEKTPGSYTITRVVPGSPAAAAGLQEGDVLYALNGVRLGEGNEEALMKAKKDWKPGQEVNYTIKRNGQEKQVALTLASMPADVIAQYVGQHMLEHAESVAVASAK